MVGFTKIATDEKSGDRIKLLHSKEYNYACNLRTGEFAEWGKTYEENPSFCPFGPTIADVEITTICTKGCEYCFPGETQVDTITGKKPISEIKVGDTVKSFSIKNNTITENHVVELYKRDYKGPLICLEIDNNKIVKMTPEHPVFVKSVGWLEAKQIQHGMEVIDIEITDDCTTN